MQKIFKFETTILLVFVLVLILSAYPVYKIVRWKMYIWLPDYISQQWQSVGGVKGVKHVIFVFVDHYEPGFGNKGVEVNREWINNYKVLTSKHQDSYGRKPQHTWFYAYDHRNGGVMSDLSKAVYDGYGEIEFHWHHGNDTNDSFKSELGEGLKWFNRYGALIDASGVVSFGFIHGNWALDNSGEQKHCGVNREMEILKKEGCYADFTFPAFGNSSQPSKVNSIYYALDDDRNKSYDTGIDAKVGVKDSKNLLIFEGPLSFGEYGAVELDPYPSQKKIDIWIDSNIHVKGRPEWVFVKVYTHGAQSRKVMFSSVVDNMFSYLEKKYGQGDYRLHYVTAREAYNLVRAAEDDMVGDPDNYLDYQIKKPLNKSMYYK